MSELITILSIFFVLTLITLTYVLAKKKALTCPVCGNKDCKKTGQKKDIERTKRAFIAGPFPICEYEYECSKCNHIFWTSIESIYSP